MGDEYMHTVYRNATRETTEWDDAQRRLGNLPALPPVEKPAAWSPAGGAPVLDAAALSTAPRARLESAEDAADDDRVLEDYRRALRRCM